MNIESGKRLIVVFAVAAALVCVSCAHRGPGGYPSERLRADQPQAESLTPDILLLDLYLTVDQSIKIAALREELLKELNPLMARMKVERERHKQAVANQTMANSGSETEYSAKLESLQGLVKARRELYLQSVMQLLNPEQMSVLKSSRRTSRNTASGWDRSNTEGDDRGAGGPGNDRMGGRGDGGMGSRGRPGW